MSGGEIGDRPVTRQMAAAAAGSLSLQPTQAGDDGKSQQDDTDARAVKSNSATAAAAASAAAALRELIAGTKGRVWSTLHSSEQVAALGDDELWPTIAAAWGNPESEMITKIVATWEGRDLTACTLRLGLPVLAPSKGYDSKMRRSIVAAVREYVQEHPQLFETRDPEESDEGVEEKSAGAAAPGVPAPSSPAALPHPSAPQQPAVQTPPRPAPGPAALSPPKPRRSPRAPASSRSADAIAALARLPSGPAAPGGPALPSPHRASKGQRSPRPPLPLVEAAGSPGADGDDTDEEYVPSHSTVPSDDDSGRGDFTDADGLSWLDSDPNDYVGAALRRGGRMRKEDLDHELARAGCGKSSFAAGFVYNARTAAGGRSMYQLYKEITSTAAFTSESSRRECLALSRILDALLCRDLAAALEHTCRRLGGVQTAAETGNWAVCARLETAVEQRSFVPEEYMRSALRSVTQMEAVKRSAADARASAAAAQGGGGSGRGGGRKSGNKDYAATQPGGTGAASKKKKPAGSGSA